jgi:hypothetical protein
MKQYALSIALMLAAAHFWASRASAADKSGHCRPRGVAVRGLDLRPLCPANSQVPTLPADATPASAGTTSPRPETRGTAVAAPPQNRAKAPPEEWYGDQTLIGDGIAVGLVLVGALLEESDGDADNAAARVLIFAGATGYWVTPLVLHGLNGRPASRAFGSLGLRMGLPLLGFFVGNAAGDCQGDGLITCTPAAAGVGTLLGIVGAMALDSAFSYKPVEDPDDEIDVDEIDLDLELAPEVSLGRNGTSLGFTGGVRGRF